MKMTTRWVHGDSPLEFSTERVEGESNAEWVSRHFAALAIIFASSELAPDPGSVVTTSYPMFLNPQITQEGDEGWLEEHAEKVLAALNEEN